MDIESVHVSYHWSDIQAQAERLPDFDDVAEKKSAQFGEDIGNLAGLPERPSRRVIGSIFNRLAKTLHDFPSGVEAVESILIGQHVTPKVRRMIADN